MPSKPLANALLYDYYFYVRNSHFMNKMISSIHLVSVSHRGVGKSRRSATLGKYPQIFLALWGAFLPRFSPHGWPFSPCGGPFCHVFLLMGGPFHHVGGLFGLYGGPFLGLPPSTKISAGAMTKTQQIALFFKISSNELLS